MSQAGKDVSGDGKMNGWKDGPICVFARRERWMVARKFGEMGV